MKWWFDSLCRPGRRGVRGASLVVLLLFLLGGMLTLRMHPILAARGRFPPPCANGTTNLQDPDSATAYSANSWVAQHTVHPGDAITIYDGAYDQKGSSGQPVVSNVL